MLGNVLGGMMGGERFPQPPTSMAGGTGLFGDGLLNLLKSNPEMLGLLSMVLGQLGQGGQGGQQSDPHMPGQPVGSSGGMGDPMSWLASLFGGSGGI